MKRVVVITLCAMLLLAVAYLFGFGFFPRHDVHIADYVVSADSRALTITTGVSSPIGYVRKMSWEQKADGLYLNFYPAFGGINGKWGAKNLFTVTLPEEVCSVFVCRGEGVFVELLRKDANGNWLYAKDMDLESITSVYHADQPIFEGPSYDTNLLGVIEAAGNYAIPVTAMDDEGNRWGRLADGRGWIDLTHVEASKDDPITAGFAWDSLLENGEYVSFVGTDKDYSNTIAFTAHKTLTDVSLYSMIMFCSMAIDRELYTLETLEPGKPLVATLMFPGDMSAYGIAFQCEGEEYFYIASLSGRNGTVVFQPFTPQNLEMFRS